MRILVFHGYLLRGTGSNVYNASLAGALARLGHEVHLVCQERAPEQLDFVDSVGDWDRGSLELRELHTPVRCTTYRPPANDAGSEWCDVGSGIGKSGAEPAAAKALFLEAPGAQAFGE